MSSSKALECANQEFKNIIIDIQYMSAKLLESIDRVRTMQWIRKLCSQNNRCLKTAAIRNEYAHYLRVMLLPDTPCFSFPFKNGPPPMGTALAPLCEALANNIASQYPKLPRSGPIRPIMCHKSPDGKAYISVKQNPGGGVSCYMAVCTDSMENSNEKLPLHDDHPQR